MQREAVLPVYTVFLGAHVQAVFYNPTMQPVPPGKRQISPIYKYYI
jgi:hypothetical protein